MLPLLPIALALIVGIVVGDAIRLPLLTWTAITGSLLATAFLFRRKAYLQHAAIMLTTMCLGAALITHTHSLLRPALPINKPVPYHAIITSKPIIHGRVTTCDMAIYEAAIIGACYVQDYLLKLFQAWNFLPIGIRQKGLITCAGYTFMASQHAHLFFPKAGKPALTKA